MKGRKGFTLIELLVVIAIIAILAAILFPVFARARRQAQLSNCQANMKQIGVSIKQYLADWQETYPTNVQNASKTVKRASVQLSPVGIDPNTQKPYKQMYGICWVEGLYNYMEPITSQTDTSSVWKCQAASTDAWASTGAARASAGVTYVMNFNMLEQPESVIKDATKLMLCREADRQLNSECRGGKGAGGLNGVPVQADQANPPAPNSTFLGNTDPWMVGGGATTAKLHANGSCVLFADGHVKQFDTSVMGAVVWDGVTSQYGNLAPVGTGANAVSKASIYVTP